MSFSSERSNFLTERTLVVGGTGLIGFHAVQALRERGHPVRVLTRNLSPTRPLARAALERLGLLGVELHQGDAGDAASMAAALDGCDRVVHAAAPYPKSHWHGDAQVAEASQSIASFLGALRPPLAAGRLRAIVFVSSSTTIGPAPRDAAGRQLRDANEDDAYRPAQERAPYFRMKWAMEELVNAEMRAGAPIVTVNPALVVGADDSSLTTGRLLLPLAKGLMQAYLPGVVPTVAARDAGEAIAEALARGRFGSRYILATENLDARELLSIAAHQAGVASPRFPLPLPAAEVFAWGFELANVLLRREWPLVPLSGVRMAKHAQRLDASRARNELALRSTPIADALHEAFAWYRSQGLI